MIYITRKEHFNAAHKLCNDSWDKAKNLEVFGKCANENWHGHNYELYVTVKGEVNKDTGFVVNLKDLGDLIKSDVIEILDHKNLNLDVKGLTNILPSTENLAIFIWDILIPKVKTMGADLHSVKLVETENNFVEYFGGK
jgi:6-pyruvoyltetrahydropterin/6-carboxytetrahydropterin synthase